MEPAAAREALSRAFALPRQLPALAGALAGDSAAAGASKAAKQRESDREAQARAIAVLKASSSAEAEQAGGGGNGSGAATPPAGRHLRPFVELAYGERCCAWGCHPRVRHTSVVCRTGG